MHFAPPSSLPRAAVGYSPASHFALSPRLIDRSRRKLCIPYRHGHGHVSNFYIVDFKNLPQQVVGIQVIYTTSPSSICLCHL